MLQILKYIGRQKWYKLNNDIQWYPVFYLTFSMLFIYLAFSVPVKFWHMVAASADQSSSGVLATQKPEAVLQLATSFSKIMNKSWWSETVKEYGWSSVSTNSALKDWIDEGLKIFGKKLLESFKTRNLSVFCVEYYSESTQMKYV